MTARSSDLDGWGYRTGLLHSVMDLSIWSPRKMFLVRISTHPIHISQQQPLPLCFKPHPYDMYFYYFNVILVSQSSAPKCSLSESPVWLVRPSESPLWPFVPMSESCVSQIFLSESPVWLVRPLSESPALVKSLLDPLYGEIPIRFACMISQTCQNTMYASEIPVRIHRYIHASHRQMHKSSLHAWSSMNIISNIIVFLPPVNEKCWTLFRTKSSLLDKGISVLCNVRKMIPVYLYKVWTDEGMLWQVDIRFSILVIYFTLIYMLKVDWLKCCILQYMIGLVSGIF